jgi:tRNA(Ile2) C34 agmatinyltransferase TiaS
VYFEMRLRAFVCPDCGEPFKSTSPNAVRCSACAKLRANRRNREYQRRRYDTAKQERQALCMLTAQKEQAVQRGIMKVGTHVVCYSVVT